MESGRKVWLKGRCFLMFTSTYFGIDVLRVFFRKQIFIDKISESRLVTA